MPTKIQVAFQGGGAKLIPLLAVAQALRDSPELVQVTRVSGTSAGAIAACLFATGQDLSRVQQHLKDSGPAYIDAVYPKQTSRIAMLTKIGFGYTLVNENKIRKAFGDLFTIFGSNAHYINLRHLTIPTLITAAELINQRLAVFSSENKEDVTIVDALFHSCGLPFLIKSIRNLGTPAYADGGIVANFPSDVLSKNSNDGPIIGVSFVDYEVAQRASNIAELALSLLNTAISAGMERAKQTLGEERVFSIKTAVKTFEFEKALTEEILISEWERVYLQFKNWLRETIPKLTTTNTLEIKPVDPSNEKRLFSSRLFDVYRAQHEQTSFGAKRVGLVVHAYCLLEPEDRRSKNPDEVIEKRVFQVEKETLFCSKIDVESDGESPPEGAANWDLFHEDGTPHKVIVLPVVDETSLSALGRPRRHVLVFFNPPLRPSEPTLDYTLVQQDQVRESMIGLKKDGRDHMSRLCTRAYDRADLVLAVPRDFPDLTLAQRPAPKTGLRPVRGRHMTEGELRYYGTAPAGFRFVGWTAQDLVADDYLGLDVSVTERRGNAGASG
jgi:predicted acylesterase/phospholipase RssA